MKRQHLFLLSFFLFFSFCNSFAQSKKIKKQIHVLLIAADDNTSIPEATVYAEGNTFKALYRATSEQSGMAVVNVETGGNFEVTVSHPKFISAKQNIKVDLYGDQAFYVLEFRLKRKKEKERLSNTLNVYVTDANKKPIKGAMVSVAPGSGGSTNSSGYAKAIHRQHPGEYIEVEVTANGYKDQRKRVLVGTAQGNAITTPTDFVSFVLKKGDNERSISNIIVEVLDTETDEPVAGAGVELEISDGTLQMASTNAQGEARFSDMEYSFEGTTAKVKVKKPGYEEKWSDITADLMTGKDNSARQFVVYLKKKTKECQTPNVKGRYKIVLDGYPAGVLQINTQSVALVSGNYGAEPSPKNTITGAFKAFSTADKCLIMEGTFKNVEYKSEGQFKFTFSSDGSSFSGTWWHNNDAKRGSWSGTKQK